MGKLTSTVPAVLVATALMAAPSGASAATEIGTTFSTGLPTCTLLKTYLQQNYAAPTDGVITRWSYQAPASNVPQLKFKVGRPVEGTHTSFMMIGESGVETPAAGALNSYPVRIPVQAGDLIGLYTATAGYCPDRSALGFTYFIADGDVAPPTTTTFDPIADRQLDLSALLEPDCDNDGLGDESQDGDLSPCSPAPTPPSNPPSPPSNAFVLGKLKRNVKKGIAFLIVFVPGPGEVGLKGKGLKGMGLDSAVARSSRAVAGGRTKLKLAPAKKGKHARRIRRALKRKGAAKVRFRVTYVPRGGVAATLSKKTKLKQRRR